MRPNLQAQTKWRWGVAVYLFLIGVGAGAYVTGVFADFLGEGWTTLSQVGVALGFPCGVVAGLFKLKQLGRPEAAWRAGMKPGTSWISRGSLILVAFLAVSFFHLVLWVWPAGGVLADAAGARHVIGLIGGVLALALMFYTGVLLAAVRPIAFWSTAMLPVLFFVSALLTGMMAVALLSLLGGGAFAGPVAKLQQIIALLLVLKAVVLIFYLQSTHRVPESRASAKLVLTGTVAPLFWIGVAVIGVGIPLGLGFLDLFGIYGGGTAVIAVLASLCGLAGGLFLRQVILAGGIHAPLRAGRFEIALPIV